MKASSNAAGDALQKACLLLIGLIAASAAFNLPILPLPGAEEGNWRDNFVDGWNRGLDGDQAPTNDGGEGPSEVAGR